MRQRYRLPRTRIRLSIDDLISADVVAPIGSSSPPASARTRICSGASQRGRQLRRGDLARSPPARSRPGVRRTDLLQPGGRRLAVPHVRRIHPGCARRFAEFPAFQIAPPLPFIPESRMATPCPRRRALVRPPDQAEKVLKPFMDVAPIVANGTGPLPYPALNAAFDALYPRGLRAYWKGAFVRELPEDAIAAHVEHGSRVPDVSATMHLYPINGACHRVGPTDTAFAYRDAKYAIVFLPHGTTRRRTERIQWVRDYYDAMAPYSEPGGYINFMQDDDYHKIHDNYRQNYDRLVQVKRAYDPGNLFHVNQNITP